jgi:hypothetical protein
MEVEYVAKKVIENLKIENPKIELLIQKSN